MAEADLDVAIRQIAKAQNKSLMAAVKKRRDQIMARRQGQGQGIGINTAARQEHASRHGRGQRLQNSAENTADSYARAIRNAAEEAAAAAKAAKKPAKKKDV
jgi:hypothetical protein